MTEKYFEPLDIDEECKRHIGFFYFAIEVENAMKKKLSEHVEMIEINGHTYDKDKKMKIPRITLFKDKKMHKLAEESVCPGTYFLAIHNPRDYEYDAHLSLLVNYDLNQIGNDSTEFKGSTPNYYK